MAAAGAKGKTTPDVYPRLSPTIAEIATAASEVPFDGRGARPFRVLINEDRPYRYFHSSLQN